MDFQEERATFSFSAAETSRPWGFVPGYSSVCLVGLGGGENRPQGGKEWLASEDMETDRECRRLF